jgi:2,3-dihydroxybenzoate decarboxylase
MVLDRRSVLAAGAAAAASTDAFAQTPSGFPLIGVEEHCLPPEVRPDWERGFGEGSYGVMGDWLNNIYTDRIAEMDQHGIEMMVLSLTAGGPQSEPDAAKAQDMTRRGNDALAKLVARRPDRFAAFGSLAMHDVDIACREFERCVRDLGMHGVMLNNFQLNGPDPESVLFYDLPQYDAFWETAQRLGAPVYLHPNYATPAREHDLQGFKWLREATWMFAVQTGTHALRIITSGVFDRYPGAQLILGHNGEHIVGDMWRINNRIRLNPAGYKAKEPVRSYFRSNVYITTSGQFSTNALKYCIEEVGSDRIMFSVDTPYERITDGVPWFRSAEISDAERRAIGRDNAIRVLKLRL